MKSISFVGFALVFVLLGIVGQSDYEEAIQRNNLYCEMKQLWEADAARGVAPEDRAGWPPFNPDISCARQQ